MTEIKQNDITFVVAGPMHEGGIESSHNRPNTFRYSTKEALQSIRKHYPEAKILLSTWEGSNTQGLEFDQLVLSKDPGSEIGYITKGKIYNINNTRMATGVYAGLKKVTTKYAVRTRTDILCINNKMVERYESLLKQMPLSPNLELKKFKQKIMIAERLISVTVNYIPFFIADTFNFGLTEDIIKLWQPVYQFLINTQNKKIIIPTKESKWNNDIKPYLNDYFIFASSPCSPYSPPHPEQLQIWSIYKDLNQANTIIYSEEMLILYYKILANNFVVADISKDFNAREPGADSRISFPTLSPTELYHCYKKICNKQKITPLKSTRYIRTKTPTKLKLKYEGYNWAKKIFRSIIAFKCKIMHVETTLFIRVRIAYKMFYMPITNIYVINKIYKKLPKFIKQWHINKMKKELDEEYNNLPCEVTISNDK